MSDDKTLPLLNIFEVETETGMRHLVGFLDPVRAGASGIESRCLVGEFEPGPDGGFDPSHFEVNPEFVAAFSDYMNGEPSLSDEIREQARTIPGKWLYIVDPRNQTPDDEDPPASDVVGAYAVDETGQVAPNSFQYNEAHLWFCPDSGVSGLLDDRKFYDWMNPTG